MRPVLLAHDLGLLLAVLGGLGVLVSVAAGAFRLAAAAGAVFSVGTSLYALSRALPPDKRRSGREEFAAQRRAARERRGDGPPEV
ncbi:hypothetical protein [Alienimonas sp. DA493]|uniref:hypothetical protein n=1 Tax=Alienimonas sp. DA493 TaxID=3373605 RepID=UPI0037546D30